MHLSPARRRNETHRGKAGRSLAKRTGLRREAEGATETAAEIEAGEAARSASSELFGHCRELACACLRQRPPPRWAIVG